MRLPYLLLALLIAMSLAVSHSESESPSSGEQIHFIPWNPGSVRRGSLWEWSGWSSSSALQHPCHTTNGLPDGTRTVSWKSCTPAISQFHLALTMKSSSATSSVTKAPPMTNSVFRDTICEVYPQHREELDTYLAVISDLALSYSGSLLHEYHKCLSAKAAMYIQKFNQRLDWSVVDLPLISSHFTGLKTLACSICGYFSHTTSRCPRTALQELSTSKSEPNFFSNADIYI